MILSFRGKFHLYFRGAVLVRSREGIHYKATGYGHFPSEKLRGVLKRYPLGIREFELLKNPLEAVGLSNCCAKKKTPAGKFWPSSSPKEIKAMLHKCSQVTCLCSDVLLIGCSGLSGLRKVGKSRRCFFSPHAIVLQIFRISALFVASPPFGEVAPSKPPG